MHERAARRKKDQSSGKPEGGSSVARTERFAVVGMQQRMHAVKRQVAHQKQT